MNARALPTAKATAHDEKLPSFSVQGQPAWPARQLSRVYKPARVQEGQKKSKKVEGSTGKKVGESGSFY
jgi:hypothetical protein